ncbi:[pt] DNA-directed RNA polymerase subunit [Dorcoceras hygrometricum]|uniref:[pt] DNA-directed RNA polymerase subunit n=1 Tax=Dorcoceras hygrometricum TaxID=472368 RepID=A0A2Z7AZN3_9LAMI|nr:[pt] DNA-directed RNA polymerase subunit [Dorcoceras hygrometricum]
METPRCSDRNKSDHVGGGTRRQHGAAQGGGDVRERSGRPREDQRPLVNRESLEIPSARDSYTIIPSDSIGYPRMKASGESSTTKHRLLHASGPHPILPPNDPKSGRSWSRSYELLGLNLRTRELSCALQMLSAQAELLAVSFRGRDLVGS